MSCHKGQGQASYAMVFALGMHDNYFFEADTDTDNFLPLKTDTDTDNR